MRGYFIGRDVKCLTDETECPGLKVWLLDMKQKEFGHMACRICASVCMIYIIKGSVLCQINQDTQMLHEGDGLFVNRENGWRFLNSYEDCRIYLFELQPDFFEGENTILAEKYRKPLENYMDFPWFYLNGRKETYKAAVKSLLEAGISAGERKDGFELEVKGLLYRVWSLIYREYVTTVPMRKKASVRETAKLLGMLQYLHGHYKEKITLAQMAGDCGVSSGEYCRFFKKKMYQTPVEYLQVYRIEKSLPEILEKTGSITEIALRHGFTGSSYYAETFKKEMGCAPGDYRKWFRGELKECPLKNRIFVEDKEFLRDNRKDDPVKEQKAEQTWTENTRVRRRESMPAHLL